MNHRGHFQRTVIKIISYQKFNWIGCAKIKKGENTKALVVQSMDH